MSCLFWPQKKSIANMWPSNICSANRPIMPNLLWYSFSRYSSHVCNPSSYTSLILSSAEEIFNSSQTATSLILSSLMYLFTDLRNLICSACILLIILYLAPVYQSHTITVVLPSVYNILSSSLSMSSRTASIKL